MLGDLVGELADQPGRIDLAEHRRRLAHRDRAGTEALDGQAERATAPAAWRISRSQSSSGRSTISGMSSTCDGSRPACSACAIASIDQPFMRGVLVDDDQAVLGLGDDVVLVELRPRRAERDARSPASPSVAVSARADGAATAVERRLRRFRETACR